MDRAGKNSSFHKIYKPGKGSKKWTEYKDYVEIEGGGAMERNQVEGKLGEGVALSTVAQDGLEEKGTMNKHAKEVRKWVTFDISVYNMCNWKDYMVKFKVSGFLHPVVATSN